ncbi:unnamed protein product, partial [Adineta ricciae]
MDDSRLLKHLVFGKMEGKVVSTQWTGAVPSCARPTNVEESDPVKWLAPTGAKPMGHDDDDYENPG